MEKMKTLLLELIFYILLILFVAGFMVILPVLSILEIGFWMIADTKFGWLVKKAWDCRLAIPGL